ncbi:hypothetical protein GCM10010441_40840 [Kitasatospora paracochleata]|uniref:PH (Pleckstrin Homology) domain-containing protein n=1 Tax=Kitasatospora paracochleata TaxID=58354 RepID=A0ABT1IR40_9ACTN|nr:hypothetical protein [Kitasatospora paracochleata]MCP2307575.1 hypothetical protein [Kitasatospora paracochleata]
MQPITIKLATRRRVISAVYALSCRAVAAVLITTDVFNPFGVPDVFNPYGVLVHGFGFAAGALGLLVLWGMCGSTMVGPKGITQRWPGVGYTIPWAKVDRVVVVRRGKVQRRRQVRVTVKGGRKIYLATPIDGVSKQVNPDFDQQAAAIKAWWESVRPEADPNSPAVTQPIKPLETPSEATSQSCGIA